MKIKDWFLAKLEEAGLTEEVMREALEGDKVIEGVVEYLKGELCEEPRKETLIRPDAEAVSEALVMKLLTKLLILSRSSNPPAWKKSNEDGGYWDVFTTQLNGHEIKLFSSGNRTVNFVDVDKNSWPIKMGFWFKPKKKWRLARELWEVIADLKKRERKKGQLSELENLTKELGL